MKLNRLHFLLLAALVLPLPASAFSIFWWEASPNKPADQPQATPNVRALGNGRVDRIVVKKSERRLYLMHGNEQVRSYKVALGYQPVGHKRYQGDGRTPEGRYYLDWRRPTSRYYKAMHISYPNPQDAVRARSRGQDPGGMVMIHGQPSGSGEQKNGDWTFGCIALSNWAIDEMWGLVEVGTPIDIMP
jgi:murein L,D-transpeptidase YafK